MPVYQKAFVGVWGGGRPAKSYKHAIFLVKIADNFDQKNASPYLGVNHVNFTISDDKKGPSVI